MTAAPLRYTPGSPQEPCMAGPNARVFRECIVEMYGEPMLASALRAVAPDARDEFTVVVAPVWMRLSTVEAVFAQVAAQRGVTAEEQWEAVVRFGAQRWFRTVWRVLLRLSSDEALIARAGMIYGKTRNVGAISSRMVGPGAAEFELTGWPGMPEKHVRSFSVAIGQVLEAAGRHDARVGVERTGDGVRFRASWRVRA